LDLDLVYQLSHAYFTELINYAMGKQYFFQNSSMGYGFYIWGLGNSYFTLHLVIHVCREFMSAMKALILCLIYFSWYCELISLVYMKAYSKEMQARTEYKCTCSNGSSTGCLKCFIQFITRLTSNIQHPNKTEENI